MSFNIKGLDLNLLLALDALYEERSVTRAADRLALSQPTVSGILNRLRDLFDDDLYVRTSHGVVPTPRAEALAGPVKQVIRATQSLFDAKPFDPGLSEFELKLCGTDYVSRTLFDHLIRDIRQSAPHAHVSITRPPDGTRGHTDILTEFDMLFTAHDPKMPDPHGMLLFDDSLICVSSYESHSHDQYVPLDALCDLSHIVGQRPLRSAVSERLSAALRERGLVRNVVLDVPDFASVFRYLQTCELVAFLPAKLAAQSDLSLKQLRVDLGIPAARVFARWHPRLENDPRHIWLREKVKTAALALLD